MKKLMLLSALAVVASGAFAKVVIKEDRHYVTPIEWGIASPLQLPFTTPYSAWRVWGLRLDAVLARSLDVYGIDAGLVGLTYDTAAGLQATAFNWVGGGAYGIQAGAVGNVTQGESAGIQIAGGANYAPEQFDGIQLAGLFNMNGIFRGIQAAALNSNAGVSGGLQLGVWNIADNEFTGASLGCVNYAENMVGVQIGVLNYAVQSGEGLQVGVFNAAGTYTGLQIGVLNLINDGERPYIFPFANARF
ncbi:MAG: hypothetical protein IJ173_07280 [Kiritimatiellae bacterium]|nr:hypothetical protein [Kiritimatiellia bacterium]